jgi:hypothetical protein
VGDQEGLDRRNILIVRGRDTGHHGSVLHRLVDQKTPPWESSPDLLFSLHHRNIWYLLLQMNCLFRVISGALLILALLVGRPELALAQVVSADNPVLQRAMQLGQIGLTSSAVSRKSPTAFRATRGRVIVTAYLNSMFEAAGEREVMATTINQIFTDYEIEAKKYKISNDASAALAFAITILHSVATGGEPDDAAFLALTPKLRSALDTPAVRAASDRYKQEVYELAICTAATLASLAAATESETDKTKLRAAAGASIKALIGADPDAITLRGSTVAIKISAGAAPPNAPRQLAPPPPTAPPSAAAPALAAGSVAPGLSFTPPQGWIQDAGWHIGRWRDGNDVTSALVRFLPAVEASGSYSDALRAAWQRYIPVELIGRAGAVIFRRHLGKGLFAQFMTARGPEKGRANDSLFSLYLIDCGTAWQPMVVAQTYDSSGVGLDMSTGFSFPRSADIAETMLATVRCPGRLGQPIVDMRSLAGNYHFGNGASMDWINIHTGASSTTFVSYGGRLNLKENGTFDYQYSSASNQGAGTTFAGIRANGTWKIEGDTLIVQYSAYDQGDTYRKKGERYRIASSMLFDDGNKLAILRSGTDYDVPINAITVADPSTYFSTKPK